jgi:hypothetical protein
LSRIPDSARRMSLTGTPSFRTTPRKTLSRFPGKRTKRSASFSSASPERPGSFRFLLALCVFFGFVFVLHKSLHFSFNNGTNYATFIACSCSERRFSYRPFPQLRGRLRTVIEIRQWRSVFASLQRDGYFELLVIIHLPDQLGLASGPPFTAFASDVSIRRDRVILLCWHIRESFQDAGISLPYYIVVALRRFSKLQLRYQPRLCSWSAGHSNSNRLILLVVKLQPVTLLP